MLEVFFGKVLEELKKQDEKWGKNRQKHPLEWFSILSEKVFAKNVEFRRNSRSSKTFEWIEKLNLN